MLLPPDPPYQSNFRRLPIDVVPVPVVRQDVGMELRLAGGDPVTVEVCAPIRHRVVVRLVPVALWVVMLPIGLRTVLLLGVRYPVLLRRVLLVFRLPELLDVVVDPLEPLEPELVVRVPIPLPLLVVPGVLEPLPVHLAEYLRLVRRHLPASVSVLRSPSVASLLSVPLPVPLQGRFFLRLLHRGGRRSAARPLLLRVSVPEPVVLLEPVLLSHVPVLVFDRVLRVVVPDPRDVLGEVLELKVKRGFACEQLFLFSVLVHLLTQKALHPVQPRLPPSAQKSSTLELRLQRGEELVTPAPEYPQVLDLHLTPVGSVRTHLRVVFRWGRRGPIS